MDRVILHCDLNSFYASVELLDRPELKKHLLPSRHCSGEERPRQALRRPDGGDDLAGQEKMQRVNSSAASPPALPGVFREG